MMMQDPPPADHAQTIVRVELARSDELLRLLRPKGTVRKCGPRKKRRLARPRLGSS
jgi:hypothetical protein